MNTLEQDNNSIIIQKKMFIFKTKEVHNATYPFDVDDCAIVTFQYCKNKNIQSDFIFIKDHITTIINLTQTNQQLWHNINETTRRLINKAKKDDILIQQNNNYDQFYQIYKDFLKQKGYSPFYGLLNSFGIGAVSKKTIKEHGTLFTASYKDEIIAGIVCLESKTSIHAWLGATKRLEVDRQKEKLISRANRLLIWHIIQYAKNKGIQEFDLGGIFSDKEIKKDTQKKGIREFKMQFGGPQVTRYQYQKIYSKFFKLFYSRVNNCP